MSNKITVDVTMDRQLFYDQQSMFGVFAFKLNEPNEEIELSAYDNFVVSGNVPKLMYGKDYKIEIKPSVSKKYGKGWEFVEVKVERPKTIKAQQEYFEAHLTELQYEAFIKAYPNHYLFDMLENDEIDHNLLDGIGEITLTAIKKKLMSDLEINRIVSELKDLDVTPVAAKSLLDHFGSLERLREAIDIDIYQLCEVKNFGFIKVDKYALNRGDAEDSPERIIAAIKYVLMEDLKTGNTWIPLGTMKDRVGRITDLPPFIVTPIINEIKKNDEHPILIESKRACIRTKKQRERQIADEIISRVNSKTINDMEIDKINELIANQEKSFGISYSDGQKEALVGAIKNNIYVINGLAGTGKTLTVKGILDILDTENYMTCALSGAAARVLASEGLKAQTMHMTLGVDPISGDFIHNKDVKLPYDVVIIDEMSMPNMNIIYSVISAVKEDAKLIMVGDMGQLPSVGEGAVFSDLLNSGIVPSQELTKIHRQAQESGIIEAAHMVISNFWV